MHEMSPPTTYDGLPTSNGDSPCSPHFPSHTDVDSRFSFVGHSQCGSPGIDPEISHTSLEDKAVRRLIASWMERLQLISVLTIFFASVEATLLSITIPNNAGGGGTTSVSKVTSAANTGLLGGLVLHILAAFISFLAGFFLIRYKIKWARKERKMSARRHDREGSLSASSTLHQTEPSDVASDMEMGRVCPATNPASPTEYYNTNGSTDQNQFPRGTQKDGKTVFTKLFSVRALTGSMKSFNDCSDWEDDKFFHIRALPTKLLGRFHVLCVVLTLLGFIFALVGIICLTWDRLPHDAGIVCAVIVLLCLIAAVAIILLPDSDGD